MRYDIRDTHRSFHATILVPFVGTQQTMPAFFFFVCLFVCLFGWRRRWSEASRHECHRQSKAPSNPSAYQKSMLRTCLCRLSLPSSAATLRTWTMGSNQDAKNANMDAHGQTHAHKAQHTQTHTKHGKAAQVTETTIKRRNDEASRKCVCTMVQHHKK